MGIWELVLLALGLAMDAFAVAVCRGLAMDRLNVKHTFIIALFFGGFQAAMPLAGWALGTYFEKYITSIDHWIAFILLSIIGGKMIYEAVKPEEECSSISSRLNIKELLVMAVATSIDALAVGITFAFLKVNIALSVSLIGIITFILSFIGVMVGNRFGSKYKNKAELAGGIVLILIGIKVLLEHLGVISF